jgi:hypothetical protein
MPTALVLALFMVACGQRSATSDRGSTAEAGTPSKAGGGDGSEETAGGKAVFPVMEHNFGEVEQGESVTYNFKVRNDGEEVLHIKKVRGS